MTDTNGVNALQETETLVPTRECNQLDSFFQIHCWSPEGVALFPSCQLSNTCHMHDLMCICTMMQNYTELFCLASSWKARSSIATKQLQFLTFFSRIPHYESTHIGMCINIVTIFAKFHYMFSNKEAMICENWPSKCWEGTIDKASVRSLHAVCCSSLLKREQNIE